MGERPSEPVCGVCGGLGIITESAGFSLSPALPGPERHSENGPWWNRRGRGQNAYCVVCQAKPQFYPNRKWRLLKRFSRRGVTCSERLFRGGFWQEHRRIDEDGQEWGGETGYEVNAGI